MSAVKISLCYCSEEPEFCFSSILSQGNVSQIPSDFVCLESTDLDEDSVNICKLQVEFKMSVVQESVTISEPITEFNALGLKDLKPGLQFY